MICIVVIELNSFMFMKLISMKWFNDIVISNFILLHSLILFCLFPDWDFTDCFAAHCITYVPRWTPMKETPATRSQFFLIQLVVFISSFNIKLRFKASFWRMQPCYFFWTWSFGGLASARLSGTGTLSLLGTWNIGLLLILCHPKCMNPIKGTITIRTL